MSRKIDQAENALQAELLAVRALVPVENHTCPQTGRLYCAEFEGWQNLYYAHPATEKKLAAFVRGVAPEIAARITPLAEAVFAAVAERKLEIAAEKQRKATKRTERASNAARKAAGPRAQCIHPESYDTLDAALAGARASHLVYFERCFVEQVARVFEALASNGWNFDATYPQPNSNGSREQYVSRQRARQYASRWVSTAGCAAGFVICSPDWEANAKADAAQQATAEFDSFVGKVAGKIGKPISSATCNDSVRIWDGATITVYFVGEPTQKWHTQCIINQSCLGLLFNQWPTRRVA